MTTAVPAAGFAGLMLGLAGSIVLAVMGLRAQRHPDAVRRRQLQAGVWCMLTGAVVAMVALEVALLSDNFAVSYVAETHSRATPLMFTVTSAWAALDGSLVLWALILAGYTAVVSRQVRGTADRLGTGALGVLGLVAAFFFGLIALAANPFTILADPPADGPGPNPILADHLMVAFHPPMLYLGFVGFTVPFAFAMSALLLREGGVDWLRRTRRSNLVAWSFLTGGVVLGAWWSYEVLGWGGYWAWDPVENAAFIPWLVATAFIHSAVVQVRRGMLQSWNFVLVLATFSLTILGTFLTRSSVVASVHSFSQSPIGPALLTFFVLVVAGGFALIVLRAERVASLTRPESLASREGVFLVNNLLLSLFAFVVLLGTTYPILVEALTGQQVSVGRPFFDRMAVPLSFALLLAMGVGPVTPYRQATASVMWVRLRLPLLAAAVGMAVTVLAGVRSPGVVAVVGIGIGIAASSARQLVVTAPSRTPAGILRLVRGQRGYWGGQLAHLGVALAAVVIAVSGGLAERATVTLDRGQSADFASYSVTFAVSEQHPQPDRLVTDAHILLRSGGEVVRIAEPRLNSFPSQPQAVGNPSVWSTPGQDIYVSLGSLTPDRVTLNLFRYPLMMWLWVAGGLMMVGGAWALSGRRRRDTSPTAPTRQITTVG
ncbi:heme lyase CcmF/NrfE family subunit [Pseudonocardia sp. KRD291]|uniref:heme lyase CcmF/NrfE family subunit n=1 Tax=Pseudonocardia sp. KRD291 TaxID=2792007 RepID=UPI001C49CF55|nr:heme lyase CcmF/NrfE family subunit [Pseudonocardia sp. KRD291]MBW0104183.1 heme lyase CcmF/NrfE family subunit [Pseudonocardia sp. KRD291]